MNYVNRSKRFFQQQHARNVSGYNSQGTTTTKQRVSELEVISLQFDAEAFSVYCGISKSEYQTLRKYARHGAPMVSLELVDRILTSLGRNDLLDQWYPWDFFDEAGRWRGYPVLGAQEG